MGRKGDRVRGERRNGDWWEIFRTWIAQRMVSNKKYEQQIICFWPMDIEHLSWIKVIQRYISQNTSNAIQSGSSVETFYLPWLALYLLLLLLLLLLTLWFHHLLLVDDFWRYFARTNRFKYFRCVCSQQTHSHKLKHAFIEWEREWVRHINRTIVWPSTWT